MRRCIFVVVEQLNFIFVTGRISNAEEKLFFQYILKKRTVTTKSTTTNPSIDGEEFLEATTDKTCASAQESPFTQASTVSPTKYLSLTKKYISSDILAKAHLLVLEDKYRTGTLNSIGKPRISFRAFLSLSKASAYVKFGTPVISQHHTIELTKMIRSQYSLKYKIIVNLCKRIQYYT